MRTLAVVLLSLVLADCAGGRGAPLIQVIRIEPPADDEIAVRQVPPQVRRYYK
jgi:hypothetical protein